VQDRYQSSGIFSTHGFAVSMYNLLIQRRKRIAVPSSMRGVRHQFMIYVSMPDAGGPCAEFLFVSSQGVDVSLDIESWISLPSAMLVVRIPYCIDVEEAPVYHGPTLVH
jgi:hypothetical protein